MSFRDTWKLSESISIFIYKEFTIEISLLLWKKYFVLKIFWMYRLSQIFQFLIKFWLRRISKKSTMYLYILLIFISPLGFCIQKILAMFVAFTISFVQLIYIYFTFLEFDVGDYGALLWIYIWWLCYSITFTVLRSISVFNFSHFLTKWISY